jgi:hypothetical protein
LRLACALHSTIANPMHRRFQRAIVIGQDADVDRRPAGRMPG